MEIIGAVGLACFTNNFSIVNFIFTLIQFLKKNGLYKIAPMADVACVKFAVIRSWEIKWLWHKIWITLK